MARVTDAIPVVKNAVYTIDITGLGSSGEGVGKYQNFTVFVPQALPGETVQVKIILVKKNYAVGKLIEVIKSSVDRIEPSCPVYYPCGGCQLQHLSYAAQLRLKQQQVRDAIDRIAKIPAVVIHPTIGTEPWHYRNKMQFPVGSVDGQVLVGCYAQRTHAIVDTEQCIIQHPANNRIAAQVKKIIGQLGIPVYDETTRQGVIRHVIGRVGTATQDVMVVLVTAGRELPHKEQLIDELTASIPNLVSIVQNINKSATNVIMGETSVVLWGQETITDRLGPFTFAISARSFFQVNTRQAERLYQQALDYAQLTADDTVIDAYCGTGTITLFLAQQAKFVYGVEYVQEAIDDAIINAQTNNVTNVQFLAGDVTQVLPALYRQGVRPEVIVLDPPRAGCDRKVLDTIAAMNPQRIVYVSCNPASLARDLAILNEANYIAREIQPFDMFPQTSHVETVVLMSRVKE